MSKKIKIVQVISGLQIGGAETLLVALLRQLAQKGYDLAVIYFHAGPQVDALQAFGVPTYHIKGWVCRYDPVFMVRLYRLLKKLDPDIIQSHLWAANLLMRTVGKLLGIPVIITVHEQQVKNTVRGFLDRSTLSLADYIVAVSPAVVDSLAQKERLQKSQKLVCIANGIDKDQVVAAMQVQKRSPGAIGMHGAGMVFGTVGRFIPGKNQRLLVEAFGQVLQNHPDAYLLLIGIGPLEDNLRAFAKELHIADRVIFVIGQSSYGYYGMMDCFVLPSEREGLSIALLEAMSCGLPCIAIGDNGKHAAVRADGLKIAHCAYEAGV